MPQINLYPENIYAPLIATVSQHQTVCK